MSGVQCPAWEHLTHNPQVGYLNPATGIWRDNKMFIETSTNLPKPETQIPGHWR